MSAAGHSLPTDASIMAQIASDSKISFLYFGQTASARHLEGTAAPTRGEIALPRAA